MENSSLKFGTGGLRAIMGSASNQINQSTITKASHAVFNYASKYYHNKELSAVISYDTRANSQNFALITAKVFASLGVKVFFSDDYRGIGQISYAIRHYRADFGVMITASHNPKEYNGYKVFWADGSQVSMPHDNAIIEEYNKLNLLQNNNLHSNNISDSFNYFGSDLDDLYELNVVRPILKPDTSKNIKITYSPLHGAGYKIIPELLKKYGYNFNVVASQAMPDPNFSTLSSPNPEEVASLTLALQMAEQTKSDLVLATDPDADRVAVAVLHKTKYTILNGNQIGALLLDYLCSYKPIKANTSFFVSTLVSSKLASKIAKKHSLKIIEVITGFKNIAKAMASDDDNFFFAMEESLGYLATSQIRDKDAVSSSLLIAQMVNYYHQNKKTLLDRLGELYAIYGYHKEITLSYVTHNASSLLNYFASTDFINKLRDSSFLLDSKLGLVDYRQGMAEFDKTSMLEFNLASGDSYHDKIFIRASGTEPKIKFYLLLNGSNEFSLNQKISKLESFINNIFIS